MKADERKRLAEQLVANPLFDEMLGEIEQAAIESLILAKTEQERVEAQWRVRSARAFREDCHKIVDSKPRRKGAVA